MLTFCRWHLHERSRLFGVRHISLALYYPHYWYLTAMIVATRKVVDRAASPSPKAQDGPVEFGNPRSQDNTAPNHQRIG